MYAVYVTFGQNHVHSINGITFDKDTVAKLFCSSYVEGRNKAFDVFGDKFFTTHTKEQIEESLHYFPKGVIEVK